MKTSVKVFLSLGIGLLALGIVIAGIGFAMGKGDFDRVFPSATQSENAKDFSGQDITGLVIDDDYNAVSVVPSGDADIHITYYEVEEGDYTFHVADHILTIEPVKKPWWHNIGFFPYQSKTVVIEVPETVASVTAEANAGSFTMENISLKGDLAVESDAGAVTLEHVTSKNLDVDSSAGSVTLEGVTADMIKIGADAGRVGLTDVVAKDAAVKTSAGKVTGQNLNITVFSVDSDAGAVQLDTVTAKDAKILTSAGKIEFAKMTVEKSLVLDSDFGAIRGSLYGDLADFTITSQVDAGESNLPSSYQGGDKALDVSASAGAVEIDFLK